MRPLQVWLPTLSSTIASPAAGRDRQRAFGQWRGENVVWLLPDLEEIVRWKEKTPRRLMAIPSERLEKIDIYHIAENGYALAARGKNGFL